MNPQQTKEFAFQLMINEYPDFRGDHDWNAYAGRLGKAGYGDVRPLLDVLHNVLLSSAPTGVKEQIEKIIKEYDG